MKHYHRTLAVCAISLVGLTACETHRETSKRIAAVVDEAQAIMPLAQRPLVESTGGRRVDLGVVDERGVNRLAPDVRSALEGSIRWRFGPAPLETAAQDLAGRLGIPIVLDADVFNEPLPSAGAGATAPVIPVGGVPRPPGDLSPQALAGGGLPVSEAERALIGSPRSRSVDRNFSYNWTGSATELLDFVTANYGLDWIYVPQARRIHFFREMTREFIVVAQLGDTTVNFGTDSSGSIGSGGRSSSSSSSNSKQSSESQVKNSVQRTLKVDMWAAISESLKKIVPNADTAVSVNPSLQSIVVRAPKPVMTQVANQLYEWNERLSRIVTTDLVIWQVNVERESNIGLDFTPIFTALDQSVRASFGGAVTTFTAATANSSVAILTGTNTAANTLRQLAGSNVIARSLQRFGQTAVATTQRVTQHSGVPTAFRDNQDTAYPESVDFSNIGNGNNGAGNGGNVLATVRPGVVVNGLDINLLAFVLGDNRVRLDVDLSFRSAPVFADFTNGGITTRFPQQSRLSTSQAATVRSGETLILVGYATTTDNTDRRGVFSSEIPLPGGAGANQRRVMLVGALTPRVGTTSAVEIPEDLMGLIGRRGNTP